MADLSSKTLKQAQPGLLHLDNGGTPIDASATARRVDGGGGTDTALYLSTTSLGVGVTPTEELHVKGAGVTTVKIDSPAANDAELKFSDNGTDKWNIFMDDSDAHKLKFIADDDGDAIIITMDCVNARLGVGTESPSREFDVHFAGADTGVGIVCYSDTVDHNPTIVFEKSHNDTALTNTETIDTEILGGLDFAGNSGSAFTKSARLQVIQNGAHSTLAPTDLVYENSAGSSLTAVWKIDKDGNMALGTRAAQATDLGTTTFDIQKTGDIIVNWESDDDDVILTLDSHTAKDSSILFNTAGSTIYTIFKDGSDSNSLNFANGANAFLYVNQSTGKMNIGHGVDQNVDNALVNIENTASGFGHEVLQIKQADSDQAFINYVGASASSGTSNCVIESTATANAKFGAIMVEINGTKKWIRCYDGPV